MNGMQYIAELTMLLSQDRWRMEALDAVRILHLNDGWIGAGFVRNAVWDHLHGYADSEVANDIDVIWFDGCELAYETDVSIEQKLKVCLPALDWSVKNQARMHLRNGDQPYISVADAMCNWPETATATAVRIGDNGNLEVLAPFGLDDLFTMRLRSTPRFASEKHHIFQQRLADKRWLARYPMLQILPG